MSVRKVREITPEERRLKEEVKRLTTENSVLREAMLSTHPIITVKPGDKMIVGLNVTLNEAAYGRFQKALTEGLAGMVAKVVIIEECNSIQFVRREEQE